MKQTMSFLCCAAFAVLIGINCAKSGNPPIDEHYLTVADRFVRTALEDERGYGWLKELTDIGARLAGSEEGLEAVRWVETKMRSLGLENVHVQSVTVPHWERGTIERAEIISSRLFQSKMLNVAALGGTEGTPSVRV